MFWCDLAPGRKCSFFNDFSVKNLQNFVVKLGTHSSGKKIDDNVCAGF